jgi:hypothetical protein
MRKLQVCLNRNLPRITYECCLTRLCRTVHTKVSVVPVLLQNNLLIHISVMKNAQNVRAV